MTLGKSITIALAAFLLHNTIRAQGKFADTALYKISYTFVYAYDTADGNKKFTENMNLYIGSSYSVFRDVDYEIYEREQEKEKQQIMAQLKTHDLSKPITRSAAANKIPKTELFKKTTGNVLYKKEVLVGKDYIIEDDLPKINWKIESETRMFGALKGQKATGAFRGRHYTAWFAPQLPVRAGPWKLYGLPGIILEASDEKKEIVFTFAGFEKLSRKTAIVITYPQRAIKTTAQDYEKMRNLYLEDPGAFINARHAQEKLNISMGGKSLDELISKMPKRKAQQSPINNPLELVKE